MSSLTIDEIAERLVPGTLLKHRNGSVLKIVSVELIDNYDFFVVAIVDGYAKKTFSLHSLINGFLIVDNEMFEPDSMPCGVTQESINDCGNHADTSAPASNIVSSYSELFRMMEQGDKSLTRYCKCFWHITHVKNLVQIVKSNAFRARYEVEGSIPFDNKEKNETSKEVMASNFSSLTERHVRFYLRPLNKPYFRMLNNKTDESPETLTLVSIKREALFKSIHATFLYPGNAHHAVYSDFDRTYALNHRYKNSFVVQHLEQFDFEKIYSRYDKELPEDLKACQQAEFLVYKELSIAYIETIYFQTESVKASFLGAIASLPVYNEIKDKCEVNWDIFHRYY